MYNHHHHRGRSCRRSNPISRILAESKHQRCDEEVRGQACVRALSLVPLSLSQDEGLFGFASLPYLQIFSIFTFSKEFFFFLFGVLIFFTFSFLFLAVF
jgi:hypothetical protein